MYHIIPVGLSKKGGPATLYMLNAPTGSSILPVDMESPLVQKNDAYIFPIKELPIETESLQNAMAKNSISHCDMIKLDVQGAELDIVLGMGEQHLQNLLSIEMEVGFQSIYKGAPRPHDVETALALYGFELFDLNLLKHHAKKNGSATYYTDILNQSSTFGVINGKLIECDMLFIKKQENILAANDKAIIGRYIAVLCIYSLYTHALQIADDAFAKGIISEAEKENIFTNVKKWSNNNRPFFRRRMFDGLRTISAKINSHIGHKAWHRQ
jgi:FkbM family methyltransferase